MKQLLVSQLLSALCVLNVAATTVYYSTSDYSVVRGITSDGTIIYNNISLDTQPQSIAFSPSGDLYIGETGGTILKYDRLGNQSTFTTVNQLKSIAFDDSGSMYVSTFDSIFFKPGYGSYSSIIKIDTSGNKITFANMWNPTAITVDYGGNVYASSTDGSIAKFDKLGNQSWLVAPNIGLTQEVALASDYYGNVFAASANGIIKKFTSDGSSTLFSTFQFNPYNDESHGTHKTSLGFDTNGILFAGYSNGQIEMFDVLGNATLFRNASSGLNSLTVAFVPEPSTYPLFGLGIIATLLAARRKFFW